MKTVKLIILACAAALAAVACSPKTPDIPDDSPAVNLVYREFTASVPGGSKTSLSENHVLWDQSGESISIIDCDGGCWTLTQKSVSSDRRTATFAGDVPDKALDIAVYPAYQDGSGYSSGGFPVIIPELQQATAGSFAPGTSPAVAKIVEGNSLLFLNVCSLLGVSVVADGIKSIKISATEINGGAICGSSMVQFGPDDSEPEIISWSQNGSVTLSGNIVSGQQYWAVVAPGEYNDLEVKFTDADGRTATIQPASHKTFTLERNHMRSIRPITITEKDWDDYVEPGSDFTLVTDASTLKAGDEVLIVYIDEHLAMAEEHSGGKYRTRADVTIEGGTTISNPGSATVLTLEAGSISGTWSFRDGDNYLSSSTSSTKDNSLLNSTTKDANSSWAVSIASNGEATIQAQAGVSTYIRYNNNENGLRFSCYNSATTQMPVAIFRRGGGSGSGSGGGQGQSMSVTVTTGGANAITAMSATVSGSWSGATATVREAGFQIGTSSSNLGEYYQADITSAASGSFSCNIDQLNPGTKYFYRAYVILQNGSDMQEFTGATASFTTNVQQDVPDTGSQPSWAELPLMNISTVTMSGKEYMVNSQNTTEYYAWHICPDFYIYHPNKKAARNYTVCFSSTYHCPVWVAAPRHRSYETGSGRSESYKPDPDIPSSIQYSSKSVGGGCNKGHMLGSAERTCTNGTNAQVFYYSNIAPQLSSGFNTGGGGWNTLEDYIDDLVCSDTLYVVIGCYFKQFTDGYGKTASPKTISYCGRDDVVQPTMFYYAVLRTKSGSSGKSVKNCTSDELKCVAFVRTHTNELKGQSVTARELKSISELEALTGVTYFPNVPNAPKGTYKAEDWGL
ncbi:MAG: DNA/RNA non-specific endonuclease [Bacteroidales bacterium]|nr:DNA/RNA non-specific endonuclease [Bacteroidales bacterium]